MRLPRATSSTSGVVSYSVSDVVSEPHVPRSRSVDGALLPYFAETARERVRAISLPIPPFPSTAAVALSVVGSASTVFCRGVHWETEGRRCFCRPGFLLVF